MPCMMPRFKLKLGQWWVLAVISIKVTSGRKQPIDTLEIELPFHKEFDLREFREGGGAVNQEVICKLGYSEPGPETVFTGVITEISPDQPLKIKCEDHGHALKLKRYKKTYSERNIYGPLGIPETWHSAIAHHAISQAGLEPVVPVKGSAPEGDFKRTTFVVDNETCGQVLDKMRETGMDWFVIPGTKQCYYGPPWPYGLGILQQSKRPVFTIGYGDDKSAGEFIPNVIAPQELKFTPSENVKHVIVYVTDKDFTKLSVMGEAGEGEPCRQFELEGSLGDNAQSEANSRAKILLDQLRTSSFEGQIKTFGWPEIRHSWQGRIYDPAHPERSRTCLIDQLDHEYRPADFKTTVTLCEREGSI